MSPVLLRLHALDAGLCRRCNRWNAPGFRRVMVTASRLGDGPAWFACAAILLLVEGAAGLAPLGRILALAALCGLVYKGIKRWSARERPYASTEGVLLLAAPLDRYSFPSGHTLHAVAFGVAFSEVVPALAVVLAPFAFLVALSRVTLGLHYPSDVAAGAVLGFTLAAGVLAF